MARIASAALALALAVPCILPASSRVAMAAPNDDTVDPVDAAIARVYPALVQIYVLAVDHQNGRERRSESAGSGAIISKDGYVVTNHHVAGRATSIRCVLSTREEVPARLVGTDVLADVAVIQLDLSARAPGAKPIEPAVFGSSEALRVGDTVLAMGCPLALSHSVTKGIVANKDMMMPTFGGGGGFILDGEDVGSLVKWIGHDAAIQPGNSGGPLVSLQGEIIGINEIGVGTMSGAIPSDVARAVVEELKAHGKVARSWIGAEFQAMLKEAAGTTTNTDARATSEGVLVGGVLAGSPAEKAGMKPGDIVLAVDGAPVHVRFREELPAFHGLILGKQLGKAISFAVRRGAEALTLSVAPEARDDAEGKEVEARTWGLTVQEITTPVAKELRRADKTGVLVGSARPGGPADQAQPVIRPGDVIVSIGGKPVMDLAGFEKITAEITAGATAPVPTLVSFERRGDRLLTLVEIGTRAPQEPTPEAKKAWFAATTQVLSRKLATALGLKGKKGVRISQVFPDSPAAAAGFQVGDVITHIEGSAVEASEPQDGRIFDDMVRQCKVDAPSTFTVWRDGKKMEVACTLTAAPSGTRELKVYEDQALDFKARDLAYFDRIERRLPTDQKGALVTEVESGGFAAVGGLRAGDLVLAVDGKPVAVVGDLEAALKPIADKKAKRTALLVMRGIHTMFIEIEPT